MWSARMNPPGKGTQQEGEALEASPFSTSLVGYWIVMLVLVITPSQVYPSATTFATVTV
jgi:hypothetical protein